MPQAVSSRAALPQGKLFRDRCFGKSDRVWKKQEGLGLVVCVPCVGFVFWDFEFGIYMLIGANWQSRRAACQPCGYCKARKEPSMREKYPPAPLVRKACL